MAVITEFLNSPYIVQSMCIALVVVLITSVWADIANGIPHRHIPLVGKTWWELTNKKARQRFTRSCRQLIAEGFAKVSLNVDRSQNSLLSNMLTDLGRESMSFKSSEPQAR